MAAPNILFIQADQMAGPALPMHGHPVSTGSGNGSHRLFFESQKDRYLTAPCKRFRPNVWKLVQARGS